MSKSFQETAITVQQQGRMQQSSVIDQRELTILFGYLQLNWMPMASLFNGHYRRGRKDAHR